MLNRKARIVASLLLVLSLGIGAGFWWMQRLGERPLNNGAQAIELPIVSGSSVRSISKQMAAAGLDVNPWVFEAHARWHRLASRLQAGHYEVKPGVTLSQFLDQLARGEVTLSTFTLIEGWRFAQLRAALARLPDLKIDTAAMSDAELIGRLGLDEKHPEGWFAPDTYTYSRQSSDLQLLTRMAKSQKQRLEAAWTTRQDGLPYTNPYELLVAASIVEKETGAAADRGKVAAVIVNRLKQSMPLQMDPTVIYGLGERFNGNLRKRDLTTPTPYNTYTFVGLTPTPISLPGAAALAAAANPEKTSALYFVARGDGTSVFSETLEAHNSAVQRYQVAPSRGEKP